MIKTDGAMNKPKMTKLDKMAKEAHKRGISYGQLQSEETVDRVRAADKANITLKSWGRGENL